MNLGGEVEWEETYQIKSNQIRGVSSLVKMTMGGFCEVSEAERGGV